MTRPSEFHKQGYTCAESVIKTYNEEFGTNIPVAIGSGMGSGFTSASLCGAIGAAVAIIGIERGRESNDSPNEARKLTKELVDNINKEFHTLICLDLKKNKVSCATIEDYTYDQLKVILKK